MIIQKGQLGPAMIVGFAHAMARQYISNGNTTSVPMSLLRIVITSHQNSAPAYALISHILSIESDLI